MNILFVLSLLFFILMYNIYILYAVYYRYRYHIYLMNYSVLYFIFVNIVLYFDNNSFLLCKYFYKFFSAVVIHKCKSSLYIQRSPNVVLGRLWSWLVVSWPSFEKIIWLLLTLLLFKMKFYDYCKYCYFCLIFVTLINIIKNCIESLYNS